ncbi:MAG: hypothetical protein Q9197_006883 [Variospora fuerteventurae]
MALIKMRQYAATERETIRSLGNQLGAATFEAVPDKICLPQVQDTVKSSARQPDPIGHLPSTNYMPGDHTSDTDIELESMLRVGSKQAINRWKMAKRADESIQTRQSLDGMKLTGESFARRCTNTPEALNLRATAGFYFLVPLLDPLALGFGAAAMVYGGLHALAWFAPFRSPIEQLLWRMSCVVVIGGIPTSLAVCRFMFSFAFQDWDGWGALLLIRMPRVLLAYLLVSAYVLARLYLVVECFIQLSHLPAGVYDMPEWSSYFPHIA